MIAGVLAARVHLDPVDGKALRQVRHGVLANANYGATMIGRVRRTEADPPVSRADGRCENEVRWCTYRYRRAVSRASVRERHPMRECPRHCGRRVEGDPDVDHRADTGGQRFGRRRTTWGHQLDVAVKLRPRVGRDRTRVRAVGVAYLEPLEAECARAAVGDVQLVDAVSYTHLRAHETPEHLVCRLL